MMGRYSQVLARGAEIIGVALFAAMFVSFLYQVFMRYVMNQPSSISEEVSLMAFIWGLFWSCSFIIRDREHVAFDLLYNRLGPQARRVCMLVCALIVGGLFVAAVPATYEYLATLRQRSPVLGWPFKFIFSCFLLFLCVIAARAVLQVVKLFGSRWREEIGS
jgi:TRAP-type C4-dicarboxylate transport system permease small subunit